MVRCYVTWVGTARPKPLAKRKGVIWDDELWMFCRTEPDAKGRTETLAFRIKMFHPSILVNVDGFSQAEEAEVERLLKGDNEKYPWTVGDATPEERQQLVTYDGETKRRLLRVHYRNPSKLGRPTRPGQEPRRMRAVLETEQNLSLDKPAHLLEYYGDETPWENQFLYAHGLTKNCWVDIDSDALRVETSPKTHADREYVFFSRPGKIRRVEGRDDHLMLNAAVSMRVHRSDMVPVDVEDPEHQVICMSTRLYWTGRDESDPGAAPVDFVYRVGMEDATTTSDDEASCRRVTRTFSDFPRMIDAWYELVNVQYNVDTLVVSQDVYKNFVAILSERCQMDNADAPNNLSRFKDICQETSAFNGRYYPRHWGRNVFDLVAYLQKQQLSEPMEDYSLHAAAHHPDFGVKEVPDAFERAEPNSVIQIGNTLAGVLQLADETWHEMDMLHRVESNRSGIMSMAAVAVQTTTDFTRCVSNGQTLRTWNKLEQQAHHKGFYINKSGLQKGLLVVDSRRFNSFPEPPKRPNVPLREKLGLPGMKMRHPFSKAQGKKSRKKAAKAAPTRTLASMFKSAKRGRGGDGGGGDATEDEKERAAKRAKVQAALKDLLPDLKPADVIENSAFESGNSFAGGFVHDAMAGFYDAVHDHFQEVTATLDFASLYPSIIMGYGICYSRIVTREWAWLVTEPERAKKYLDARGWTLLFVPVGNDESVVFVVGKRVQFDKDDHARTEFPDGWTGWRYAGGPRALLPDTIEQLVNERRALKRKMKQYPKGSFLYELYNSMQLACKVIQNAMYGFLGAKLGARLSYPALSAAVCAIGQLMNRYVTEFLQRNWDCTVVYGDSVTGRTLINLVRKDGRPVAAVEAGELYDMLVRGKGTRRRDKDTGKEYVVPNPGGPAVYVRDGGDKPVRLQAVMRHKAGKRVYEVVSRYGVVEVTEDHSLLDEDGRLLKPGELAVGRTALMTAPCHGERRLFHRMLDDVRGLRNMRSRRGGVVCDQPTANAMLQRFCCVVGRIIVHEGRRMVELLPDAGDAAGRNTVLAVRALDDDAGGGDDDEHVYDLSTASGNFQAGCGRTVVKNTDSVMVQFPPPPGVTEMLSMEERLKVIWPHCERMAEACQILYPYPNDLEFEALKLIFLLIQKKNYACMAIEKVDEEPELVIKGLPGKKRDRCPLVRETNKHVLEMLMRKAPAREVAAYIDEQLRRLVELDITMDDLVITCAMKDSYKGTPPIQVAVAGKMLAKGLLVEAGQRVKYVMTKGDKMGKPEGSIPEDARLEDIDLAAYMDSQFRVVLDTLTLFHTDIPMERIYNKHLTTAKRKWSGARTIAEMFGGGGAAKAPQGAAKKRDISSLFGKRRAPEPAVQLDIDDVSAPEPPAAKRARVASNKRAAPEPAVQLDIDDVSAPETPAAKRARVASSKRAVPASGAGEPAAKRARTAARRLVVAGPRNFADRALVYTAIEEWCAKHGGPPDELVHGGARGVDALAGNWAACRNVKVRVFKAKWGELGPAAGPARNREMAEYGTHLLAVDRDTPGTANMVMEARKRGVEVTEV